MVQIDNPMNSARAADAPSEPSDENDLLEIARTLCSIAARRRELTNSQRANYPHVDEEGSPVLEAARAACVKRGYTEDGLSVEGVTYPRAADALDSQPTSYATMYNALEKIAAPATDSCGCDFPCQCETEAAEELNAEGMRDRARKALDAVDAAPKAATQPTVAAQQGSIGEDTQFQALLDNVTQNYGAFLQNTNVHGFMSAVAGLHTYVDHLLDSRASSAPVAPIAPDGWVSIAERLPELHVTVALLDEIRWMNTGSDGHNVNWHGAGYLCEFGQKYWSVFGESRSQCLDAVTHWMPLPPAPQQEGSEAGNG